MHTSAKARLISVMIGIRDPDRHQTLIICSLAHCQPSLKISRKSIRKFLRKVANRQTDKQQRKHNLLVGRNKETHFILLEDGSCTNAMLNRQHNMDTHTPPLPV